MSDAIRSFDIVRRHSDGTNTRVESVAHEEPLELQINGASVAVVMRTPGHDEELARGFLLTERIVGRIEEIASVRHCSQTPDPESEGNVIQIRLASGVPFDLERLRRHSYASSSCGVCGKATIENACGLAPPLRDEGRIAVAVLLGAPAELLRSQPAFAETGGLHAAGLFTLAGELVAVREDVGRHNAVDKIVGYLATNQLNPADHALFVSGRISFELVQKAAAARLPILAGISAPTSLAVRVARALRVTLVGFVRGTSLNVYSEPGRIVD